MCLRRTLGVVAFLSVALSLTIASAQLEVVEEHIFDFSAAATPWEMSVMVPYYNPENYGGRSLEEVMVTLEGNAQSDIDVTATGGDVVVVEGEVGAYVTATGFISGLIVDVLPKGQFAPPAVNVPMDTTVQLTDISGYDLDIMVLSHSSDQTQGFVGDGAFDVTIESSGTSTLSTSGGNMNASQRTEASGRLTVQYKVAVVPEPTSTVLLVLGIVGAVLLRRR